MEGRTTGENNLGRETLDGNHRVPGNNGNETEKNNLVI